MNYNFNMNAIIAENEKYAESTVSSTDKEQAYAAHCPSPSYEALMQCNVLRYEHSPVDKCSPPPSYWEASRQGLRACRSTMNLNRQTPSIKTSCPAYTDAALPPTPNSTAKAKPSSFMLDLIVGQTLANKLTQKRDMRRQRRLNDVHDAWLKLGVDTRKLFADGRIDLLPPHFYDPPRYDAEELNRRLRELAL